jgi:hypothetical protein
MASLFFACEVHRAIRTVVSADNIIVVVTSYCAIIVVMVAAANMTRTCSGSTAS